MPTTTDNGKIDDDDDDNDNQTAVLFLCYHSEGEKRKCKGKVKLSLCLASLHEVYWKKQGCRTQCILNLGTGGEKLKKLNSSLQAVKSFMLKSIL
jgi:hypothetical protein